MFAKPVKTCAQICVCLINQSSWIFVCFLSRSKQFKVKQKSAKLYRMSFKQLSYKFGYFFADIKNTKYTFLRLNHAFLSSWKLIPIMQRIPYFAKRHSGIVMLVTKSVYKYSKWCCWTAMGVWKRIDIGVFTVQYPDHEISSYLENKSKFEYQNTKHQYSKWKE